MKTIMRAEGTLIEYIAQCFTSPKFTSGQTWKKAASRVGDYLTAESTPPPRRRASRRRRLASETAKTATDTPLSTSWATQSKRAKSRLTEANEASHAHCSGNRFVALGVGSLPLA